MLKYTMFYAEKSIDGRTIMAYQSDELIHTLKCGSIEDLERYKRQELKTSYADSFPGFMTDMLDKYGVKKGQVASRSGLSKDYTLKLLRGDKTTKERDYILAMAIVIGMSLDETQHALGLNGMSELNRADPRSAVIVDAIVSKMGLDQLNDYLEKAGFNYIKVSPNMPSSQITLISTSTAPNIEDKPAGKHKYEQLKVSAWAEHIGSADPMAYEYGGTVIVEDEKGKRYYVHASFLSEGSNFCVTDDEEYLPDCRMEDEENYEDIHVVEEFDSLYEAASSEFFEFYLLLDRVTDNKCRDTLESVDDTRNYGSRCGAVCGSSGEEKYIEAFNTAEPARREYLQIREYPDGKVLYTASHESYFLRYHVGDLYSLYFSNQSNPEYFIITEDTASLPEEQSNLRLMFQKMQQILHKQMPDSNERKQQIEQEEKLRELVERATQYAQNQQFAECDAELGKALKLMNQIEEHGIDKTVARICALGKIDQISHSLRADFPEIRETICGLYDKLCGCISNGVNLGDSPLIFANAALSVEHEEREKGEIEASKTHIQNAIDILNGRCENEESWKILVVLYADMAYAIDESEPEKALEFTGKAIEIMNEHSFFAEPRNQNITQAIYYNHGWVLWEKLHDEEAVFYYKRALELQEAVVRQSKKNDTMAEENLWRIGDTLYQLYIELGKDGQAKQLKKEMKRYSIDI